MKNKLILFDWGNIVESHLTGFTCYDGWNELFKRCGYNGNENIYSIFKNYKDYCLEKIKTEEEFEKLFDLVSKDYNFNVDYQEFKRLFKETFSKVDYYKDVVDYEHSLKDKCYIGILSNLNVFEKERLDKQVDLSKYDYVFLSFELGLVKPSKDIFEYIQNHVNFDKKDILFIDDKEGNVNSAKEFGWNAYKLTGLELDKIKEVCENFLKN